MRLFYTCRHINTHYRCFHGEPCVTNGCSVKEHGLGKRTADLNLSLLQPTNDNIKRITTTAAAAAATAAVGRGDVHEQALFFWVFFFWTLGLLAAEASAASVQSIQFTFIFQLIIHLEKLASLAGTNGWRWQTFRTLPFVVPPCWI